MKKWNIALAVFLIGAGTLTACSGKSDTLAPEKAETKAEWGLNFYENTTEKESEESKAEESSSENRILEAADGVMLMELEDMKLQAASPVNVRKGPGTSFEKLGGLAAEQEVTMTGLCDNNWARILFEGETGYVSASYLTSPDGSVSLSELLEQVKAKVEESAKKSSDEETSEAETSEESSEEESSE
ncbi:MAG: SH3 domain-containing protein [Lachnospiraceae bacterium]|nr:SH3 domain-containing protein [Lachnospiraceae bacterium]